MKRLQFDSQGKLLGVDGTITDFSDDVEEVSELKKSENLTFLKKREIEPVFDNSSWSLYSNKKKLDPLLFSNGKTQEDVVKEVVGLINSGKKVVFLHGTCGTGKSAIALNIARELGRASIVVPIKSLQNQYEQDYMKEKYVVKKTGQVMRIAMITGRENHDSIIVPGISCADPMLPDTIKITEKNFHKIEEYYKQNPFIKGTEISSLKDVKRISIAPANPYWSPILPADYELQHLRDARKKRYTGMGGREFIFYHRKEGCSYYDQYCAYLDSDVLIFNAAKYKLESALGRKPETDVEIIDEADEFLDNLSYQTELNINRLVSSLKILLTDSQAAQEGVDKMLEFLGLEEKAKKVTGVQENEIFSLKDTKFKAIFDVLLKNSELQAELALDELNYANRSLEAARNFEGSFDEVYLTYRKHEDELYATFVTTNLAGKVKELVDMNKAVVFMSGTLHSPEVLRNVFGIEDFEVVEAETVSQGAVEIHRTGKEVDCRYSSFKSNKTTREDYLSSLSACIERAKKPALVHVNAFEDLPTDEEITYFSLSNLVSRTRLKEMQDGDKKGNMISVFKSGLNDVLFSTKCSRGIDFPGNICNSVIFTKYPNPNVNNIFWKILQKTHPDSFWEFYRDKARREFLQRIYRAVRSKNDHVFVLSPDIRVSEAVREMQMSTKVQMSQRSLI